MCHVSHLYETGASLYFTLHRPPATGEEIEQWRAVKQAAGERDPRRAAARSPTTTRWAATTRPGWQREVGGEGVAALRALKAELDPGGIMNPGKLLPAS